MFEKKDQHIQFFEDNKSKQPHFISTIAAGVHPQLASRNNSLALFQVNSPLDGGFAKTNSIAFCRQLI